MSDLLVRVDDCLVHAQVLHTWRAAFAPQRIVLAHDATAADARRAARYRDLADDDVAIEVIGVDAAAAALQPGRTWPRTLVVVGSAADALRLVAAGAAIDAIQLGGLHAASGKEIAPDVAVDALAARALSELLARGIRIEARHLPAAPGVPVDAALLARLWPDE